MNDSQYRLIPARQLDRPTQPSTQRFWPKVVAGVAGASLLVVAALYAPVMWQTLPVAAEKGAGITASAPRAALREMNASLVEDQEALAALYEEIAPSVVSVQVIGTPVDVQLPPGFDLPPGFETPGDVPQSGEGSGFIFDNDGHIVTNNHVVANAEEITVVFSNGYWADAKVVAADPQADLAVLEVTPPDGMDWQPLALADLSSLKVGHMVIAFGNPFYHENTMTTGIVSALGRSFQMGAFGSTRYSLPGVIQTDAAINPGNSGGPLVNLNGELVGINFAIDSLSRQSSGVGFAIPVSIVGKIVPSLIENGKFEYPYLGLSGQTISPQLARAFDLANTQLGAYVASVVADGPSEKAGVQGGDAENPENGGGDIVIAIDQQEVNSFEALIDYLVTETEPGQTVTLTVLRDGEEVEIEVELGVRPAQAEVSVPEPGSRDDSQGGGQEQPRGERRIRMRDAIQIAREAVTDQLDGTISQVTSVPDDVDGKSVWVVTLSTETQTATVVVDRETGDVISSEVK